MSMIQSDLLLGQEGGAGYVVERSLRFNASDSAYLSRVPSTAGNRKTWTWAGWVKRSKGGARQGLFGAVPTTNSYTILEFDATDGLTFYDSATGGVSRQTSAVYRDYSAWMHVVLAVDTTAATAANRVKLYVNGSEVTVFASSANPAQNTDTQVNVSQQHVIGSELPAAGNYLDGYLADIHFIDGQALTPSSFTEVSATTGQLIPKAYTGSFGTNGFWLKFSDNSAATATTLGKDYSGNSNNWTPNNLSVTAGAGNDSLVDTPTSAGTDTGVGGVVTGNYCTLNPLDKGSGVSLANGNLDVTITTPDHMVRGTVAMPASGKWYFEFTPTVISGTRSPSVGIANSTLSPTASNGYYSASAWTVSCGSNGNKQHNNSETSYASAFAVNDVGMCAVDLDNGKIWWGKNGTWFASGNPATGANAAFTDVSGTVFPAVFGPDGGVNCTCIFNFGARSFSYAAPSGYKCLVDTSLPAPVVAKSSDYFQTLLYTGNGGTQTISGLGFSPDFLWFKARSIAYSHALYDTVRGYTKSLVSNSTVAEGTEAGGLSAFNSDGFSLNGENTVYGSTNTNGQTYVAWAWDAGSSTVTNTQGSITSQVRANASAGFSIVTASVSASASGPLIGHGLGVTPALVVGKNRSSGVIPWYVWSSSLAANNKLILNSTAAAVTDTNTWGSMTSSTLQMGATGTAVNVAWIVSGTQDVVFYCFAPVAGYSSFGSWTGNGSTDGPFVYTGFRPRWVMWKPLSSGTDWVVRDAARDSYNIISNYLLANSSAAEGSITEIDFLSNGFKFRNNLFGNNTNGVQVIYACFAEAPFQYARAR